MKCDMCIRGVRACDDGMVAYANCGECGLQVTNIPVQMVDGVAHVTTAFACPFDEVSLSVGLAGDKPLAYPSENATYVIADVTSTGPKR